MGFVVSGVRASGSPGAGEGRLGFGAELDEESSALFQRAGSRTAHSTASADARLTGPSHAHGFAPPCTADPLDLPANSPEP